MKFLPYLLKHLRRNWFRTTLTVLAMALCIFLFCTLQSVLAQINGLLEHPRELHLREGDEAVLHLGVHKLPLLAADPGGQTQELGEVHARPFILYRRLDPQLRGHLHHQGDVLGLEALVHRLRLRQGRFVRFALHEAQHRTPHAVPYADFANHRAGQRVAEQTRPRRLQEF